MDKRRKRKVSESDSDYLPSPPKKAYADLHSPNKKKIGRTVKKVPQINENNLDSSVIVLDSTVEELDNEVNGNVLTTKKASTKKSVNKVVEKAATKKIVKKAVDKPPAKKTVKKAVDKSPAKKTVKKVSQKKLATKYDNVNNEELDIDNVNDVDESQFHLWDPSIILSGISGVPHYLALNFIKLIEDDNTLPFIARYRKAMVDNMTPESLQELFDCYTELCKMRQRALGILKILKKNGKLSSDLERSIIAARSIAELDLLYEPLKQRSGTLADRARELGLDHAAQMILNGCNVNISSLCNPSIDGLKTPEEVEENIVHILADVMYKDSRVLEKIRKLKTDAKIYVESSKAKATAAKSKTQNITSAKTKDVDVDKYNLYLSFRMRVDYIKPHQTLALNRGEAAKVLSIKIDIPDWFHHNLERFCLSIWRGTLISKGVADAYKRLIKPWLSRQVRSEMTSKAEKESIAVFASNLKRLLMTAPIKGNTILGIDPGFKAGCKIGVVNQYGQVLDTYVIYPIFHNNSSSDNEVQKLKRLIDIHQCKVIALGNGTACRETEKWLKKWGFIENIPLVIVPEQGASIYSCSPDASKEHPGMDPNLISALSIARRALDPLSELVKVEPKHIGVGLYQHDAPPKLMNEALNNTVISCASFVGADLNTTSITLLRKIAGLTETKAKAIIAYRDKNGSFTNREELLKVSGIGPKIFKQCVGFLRVPQSKNKLDNTWIHPESYDLAHRLLKEVKLSPKDIGTIEFLRNFRIKTSKIGVHALASTLNCGECDIQLIIDALSRSPHEDPLRNNKPIYSMAVDNINNLREGARLTGVVSNVTPFGCFVDCGVGRDGLIHNSQMGGSRVPQLGERVVVTVIPQLTDKKLPLRLEQIMT